jgi:hypothetical protein
VPTNITINPNAKPAMTTLRDLTKQMLIIENLNAGPGAAQLASVRATYLRACELWPAAMRIAAAIVANDNTFTAATLDALKESDAP